MTFRDVKMMFRGCQNGVRGMILVTKSCPGDDFGVGLILKDGGCHFGISIWDPRMAIVFGMST